MKNKVILSIAISSFSGLLMSKEAVAAEQPTLPSVKAVSKAQKPSGKCASGKCGTEKIYGQAKINYNPQEKLVLARDGKCGVTGYGLKATEQERATKIAGGVCGQ